MLSTTGYEQLYWITRLDGLHYALSWCLGLSIVAIIIYLIGLGVTACEDEDMLKNWKKAWRPYRWFIIPFISLVVLLKVFVPSKDDALLILGGGTVLEYVETNKDLQTLPDKAVEALTQWADGYLEKAKKAD